MRQQTDLEAAYRAHCGAVLGFAHRFVGEAALAEDLAQEAFARLLIEQRKGKTPDNARAWLLTVVRNLALSHFDHKRVVRRRLADAPEPPPPQAPDAIAQRAEAADLLNAALDELTEPFRSAVILCDIEGLSYEEAATICETNVKTMSSRLSRGRRFLRDRLEGRIGEGAA